MISLNMIVGHFYEPFLDAAIASVQNICDEFIVIDTAPGNNPNRDLLDSWARKLEFPNMVIIDMPRGLDKDFSFAKARELARVNSTQEWCMRLDADEVMHEYDEAYIIGLVKNTEADMLMFEMTHFMVTPDWVQPNQGSKALFFKRDKVSWTSSVHETMSSKGAKVIHSGRRFYHYGYCRGPEEVYKRWKLYTDIDGRPTWYNNTDPATILDDRISACEKFTGTHPVYVQPMLDMMFSKGYRYAVIPSNAICENGEEVVWADKDKITIRWRDDN